MMGVLGIAGAAAFAQLQPGDIAFTGFNADAGNGESVAFVALKDIPAGDTLRFCDSEWTGTAFGADEGTFAWVATSLVPAGTVVRIDSISSGTTTASVGQIIAALDSSGGIGNSDEAYFVFQGPSSRVPTTFLAAVATRAGSFGTLTGTGLTLGSTAVVFRTDIDVAAYTGPRTGLNKAGYLAALADTANWIFQDGSGNEAVDATAPDVPFDNTAFSFAPVYPLGPGDIAFTGFNADAPDNLAFVALKDIPANTRIYFCDANWNGTAFPSGEGDFSWMHTSVVPAGTVVALNSIDPGITTNIGTIVHDNGGGISTGSEAFFAYLAAHPDSLRKPSVFLAAISNNGYGTDPGVLTGTGLVQDGTAIRLRAAVDFAIYNGTRAGSNKAGYLAALADTANWLFEDGSGNESANGTGPELPFNLTAFTFGTVATDTVKPTVSSVTVINATTTELVFSERVDSTGAVALSNYVFNPARTVAAAVYNAALRKITLTHAALPSGLAHTLQVSAIKDTANNTMNVYTSPSLTWNVPVPALSFGAAYYSRRENSGTLQIPVNASVTPAGDTARVGIRLVNGGTAVAGTDFTFADTTFVWPKDSTGPRMLSIPLLNNTTAQPDRFFVLEMHTPSQATLGTTSRVSVYILDDDTQAPAATPELDLKHVSSFRVDTTSGASAEIVAHDPTSQRLFAMNSTRDKLEILNFRNPRAITKVATIDLLAYGTGGTSVAARGGIVAVSIDTAGFQPGKVVFLDTNGVVKKAVKVGSLPDMLTFTPDGRYVLVANEGQPSNDYLTDPEGSVSIIDLQGGLDSVSQARVTTAGFTAFNGQEATLRAGGGRIFGVNATVAKDLEPEYIAVSEDSKTAWVTLQENNIIARLDLQTKAFTNLFPLGMKDHTLPRNALDASDQLDSIFMGTWPVKGVYMPDAIASLKVGDSTYLFTANEGDAREYGPINEDIRVSSANYKLDSLVFPNAAILKLNTNIGRLSVSPYTGDTDNDGFMEEIHVLGARSFSVWNGATGAQVWDSGDELERITAADATYRSIFNASNDNVSRKNRSDNKGPEPEGIVIGKIGAKHYAFIALERTGGVVAYDVTNPHAPRFVQWANNRTTASLGGDLGSEGIIFIPRAQSPKDTAYVVMANEVSATVSVYSVRDTSSGTSVRSAGAEAFAKGRVSVRHIPGQAVAFFDRPADFRLTDARGKVLREGTQAPWVDLEGLKRGRYFLAIPGTPAVTLDVGR